jgi:hypothetical protein
MIKKLPSGFQEKHKESEDAIEKYWTEIVAEARRIAGPDFVSVARVQEGKQNRRGRDLRIETRGGDLIWAEVKCYALGAPVRESDTLRVCLETWSVCPCGRCPSGQLGWTLDGVKRSQYIFFLWHVPGMRWCHLASVDARKLRTVFQENLFDWKDRFPYRCNDTKDRNTGEVAWHSMFMTVPLWDVRGAIRRFDARIPPRHTRPYAEVLGLLKHDHSRPVRRTSGYSPGPDPATWYD